jgi:hypothetical protein
LKFVFFSINWVFLVISIIIVACFTKVSSDNDIQTAVTNFAFDVLRCGTQQPACKALRDSVNSDAENEQLTNNDQEDLGTICERYNTALACYNIVYSSLNDNVADEKKIKDELDAHDQTALENICGTNNN